jgi:NAD(P)-dependent dehydrogenase (short-subunit alcohol dehydrogenase family)
VAEVSRTAVILGAGGDIGHATCRSFADSGITVWAVDIDEPAAVKTASSLVGEHHAAAVDVTDAADVEALAARIWELTPFDSVVYAAGTVFTADVVATDWSEYRHLMAVNLDGAFYCAASFVGHMLGAGKPGSLVFLSSMAGRRGEAGASAYCASKFGLIGLVQSLAAEVAEHGIRVNAVCPGNVRSRMLDRVIRDIATRGGTDPRHVESALVDSAAAKRLVEAEEVAEACLWLCSPRASAVTGEALGVDAGVLLG